MERFVHGGEGSDILNGCRVNKGLLRVQLLSIFLFVPDDTWVKGFPHVSMYMA